MKSYQRKSKFISVFIAIATISTLQCSESELSKVEQQKRMNLAVYKDLPDDFSVTETKKGPVVAAVPTIRQHIHGAATDPFVHLEDRSFYSGIDTDVTVRKKSIRALVEAENKYAEGFVDPELQEKIYQDMKSRIIEDDVSFPTPKKRFEYLTTRLEGKNYPQYRRRPISAPGLAKRDPSGDIFLDVNVMAEGHSFYNLTGVTISPCENYVAYALDTVGSEMFSIAVKNIETGQVHENISERVCGAITWHPNGRGLFILDLDAEQRPKVLKYVDITKIITGADTAESYPTIELYRESVEPFTVSASTTKDNQYLVVRSGDHGGSKIMFMNLSDESQTLHEVIPESLGAKVDQAESWKEKLYFLINDGAHTNYRIASMDVLEGLDRLSSLETVVDSAPGQMIQDMFVQNGYLCYSIMRDAQTTLHLMDIATNAHSEIPLAETLASVDFYANLPGDYPLIRFFVSSMKTPANIYEYDPVAKTVSLCDKREIPGYNPDLYATELRTAKGHDGVEIPVTIVYQKSTGGSFIAKPTYINAYGSYGFSYPISFNSRMVTLLNNGFNYAIVHARGGTEKGYEWYLDGKELNKMNTFKDVISGTEHILEMGFAKPDAVVLEGGSAGGLLTGYCANNRPDLYTLIIHRVPFFEVINDITDATLPLTAGEWREWGNPIESKEVYEYMKMYSPYDNFGAQDYPQMLILAGLNDYRVPYWEALKAAQKIRQQRTDNQETVLYMEMEAGHSGGTARYKRLHDDARNYAFLWALMGDKLQKFGES